MIPLEIVLFNAALIANALQTMSLGGPVSVFQHNLICAAFAQAMDRISQPGLAVVGGQWPVTMSYDGQLPRELAADGKQPATIVLPTFGLAPRPPGGEAQKWWDACAEFLLRLGDTWQLSQGTTAIPGSSVPVLVSGPAYDAVIAMRQYPGPTTILEDRETATIADPLYSGVSAFIQRAANAAAGVQTEMSQPERAAQSRVDKLNTEFRENQQRTGTAILVGSAAMVGFSAWWGMKKQSRGRRSSARR